MIWHGLQDGVVREHLGFIPTFLSENDPRPAAAQFAEKYIGGWRPFRGFTMVPETYALTYPSDPDYYPLAKAQLRDETILIYPHEWVAVVQADGTFEVSRMD